MSEIIPAILESSYNEIISKLEKVLGSAPLVQLDICDGTFVPSLTWPYVKAVGTSVPLYETQFRGMLDQTEEMPFWEDVEYELDLMIADPKRLAADLVVIGPSAMIFHIETLENPVADLQLLRKEIPMLVAFGIAISPNTPIESIFPVLDVELVESVQCMGIEKIGVQGSSMDERIYDRIQELRAKYPDILISVDGGVSLAEAPKLLSAGANRLVSGSAIFKSENPKQIVEKFKAL